MESVKELFAVNGTPDGVAFFQKFFPLFLAAGIAEKKAVCQKRQNLGSEFAVSGHWYIFMQIYQSVKYSRYRWNSEKVRIRNKAGIYVVFPLSLE